MSDIAEIQDLVERYCELSDTADWDGLGSLFEHGALVDDRGGVLARGAAAVTDYFARGVKVYDGSPRTRHLVSKIVIETATSTSLIARLSFLVLQEFDDDLIQPIAAGRYRDTFARSEEGWWRFAERRYELDLAGDLSRHLNFEVR